MKELLIGLLAFGSFSAFACQCAIPDPVEDLSQILNVEEDQIEVGDIEFKVPAITFISIPYFLPKYFIMGKERREEAWGACECGIPGEKIIIKIKYQNSEDKNCHLNFVKPAMKRVQLDNFRVRKHYCDM